MESFKSKMEFVLETNSDLHRLQNVAKILNGTSTGLRGMNPNLPALLRWAPIMSVDCERTFSKLKTVLADQRISLTSGCVTLS